MRNTLKQRHLNSKDLGGALILSADPAYAEPQKSICRNSHSDPLHGALQTSGKAVWEGVFALFPSVENFHLMQMSAKGLRVPPPAPPFTQRINQALCSHSLERESSLLAVCYDLHVVCKSYPKINLSIALPTKMLKQQWKDGNYIRNKQEYERAYGTEWKIPATLMQCSNGIEVMA